MFVISPSDVKKAAEKKGVDPQQLRSPKFIILTFSLKIIEEITKQCGLIKWKWEAERFSPYSTSLKSFKGRIDDNYDIGVFIPPMGASPLIAFCEELIYFGAEAIFLLCASWGLGEDYLSQGQIHLPNFAIGFDGTSSYYGNEDWDVKCETTGFTALKTALDKFNFDYKVGGVGCCEAIYRISSELVNVYRTSGCLSIENGEVASLYSLAHVRNISTGVLLQPYIDLAKGWELSYMGKTYHTTCKLQAKTAIEAFRILGG